jgi:catechol 2,3-dioxygenase-like lactoylglutathione lyase family enzyme
MGLQRLDHYSIRTTRLEETRTFYTQVMELTEGPRPAFPFPGAWLYQGEQAVVHVIGIDPNDRAGLAEYLGDRAGEGQEGTGMIDHIAFTATDTVSMRTRLKAAGLDFTERSVPNMDLHQIFVQDPNGVTIELNYRGAEA